MPPLGLPQPVIIVSTVALFPPQAAELLFIVLFSAYIHFFFLANLIASKTIRFLIPSAQVPLCESTILNNS